MASGISHPALPSTSTNYEMDPAFSLYKRRSNLSSKARAKRSRLVYSNKSSKRSKCHICGIVLQKISTLRNHLKFTHGDFVFQCPHCQKLFTRPSNAQKHIQVFHPEVPLLLGMGNYKTLMKSQVPPHVSNAKMQSLLIQNNGKRGIKTQFCSTGPGTCEVPLQIIIFFVIVANFETNWI